jgi:hypothetical protein
MGCGHARELLQRRAVEEIMEHADVVVQSVLKRLS